MSVEKYKLKNGLTVTRFNCKDGYIEYVSCFMNPDDYDGGMQVAPTGRYFRLCSTDGWMHSENFNHKSFHLEIFELRKEFIAQEIWNSYLIQSESINTSQ